MGSAVGVEGTKGPDIEETLQFDETSTLYISISSDTDVSYSKLIMAVKTSDDKSVLAVPVDTFMVHGYSWSHGNVATPEDDEKNISAMKQFSPEQKAAVLSQCMELGLNSRYIECFAKPATIPADSVFMNVKFELKTSENMVAFSELSGCVLKADLQGESMASEDGGLDRGTWLSRMKEILPGERFETYRRQAKETWVKVERIVEAASGLKQTESARTDFYEYSKKQSQSYQSLLEKGMTSPEGERLIREIEHLKRKCHQAAHIISSSVLGSLFGKGQELVGLVSVNALEGQVRFEEAKKNLQVKFEHDIFSLAEFLTSREAEAWERLNARFQETNPTAVAERMKQHEESSRQEARSVRIPSPFVHSEEVQENSSRSTKGLGDERGRDKAIRRGSSFGTREGGRRRTLSPSRSFHRSDSRSPRPPVMRKRMDRSKSPNPSDHALSTATPVGSEQPPESNTLEEPTSNRPTGQKFKRNLRRSFTIQPVESFSAATAEVVEMPTHRSNTPSTNATATPSSLSAILNLTNAAAQASKRRLAQRLSLQKTQKSREQDTGFMLHSIFEFEYLMFDLLMTQKMTQYMEKEYNLLQSKLATTTLQESEELAVQHKKEIAHALTENKGEEDIAALKSKHAEEKTHLDNRLTEKKRSKRAAFEDARFVTMEKLAGKLEKIRDQSRVATLSPAGLARIQNIFQIFTALRNEN